MFCRWCDTEVDAPCSKNPENKAFNTLPGVLFSCEHFMEDRDAVLPTGNGTGTSFDLTDLVSIGGRQ